MKYIFWTSTYYTLLALFELHLCVQAITLLDGAEIQCASEFIVYDYIVKYTFTREIILENVVSVMHVGGYVIPPPPETKWRRFRE
jgi:hypothetical protein